MELRQQLESSPPEAFGVLLAAVFRRAAMDLKSGTPSQRREARDFLVTSAHLVEELGMAVHDYDSRIDELCEQWAA